MTRISFLFCLGAAFATGADIPSAADQIAAARSAAPEELRADSTVLGYKPNGKLKTLKKGDNDMVCLADTPGNDSFSVACYHTDLEPFMARGRELTADGLKGRERHEARWKEVDDGKLEMPREPRMLYVLTGDGFDSSSGKVVKPYLRWVVYTAYATPESTGLSTEPGNAPWLMYPGKPGAHIMISPPKD